MNFMCINPKAGLTETAHRSWWVCIDGERSVVVGTRLGKGFAKYLPNVVMDRGLKTTHFRNGIHRAYIGAYSVARSYRVLPKKKRTRKFPSPIYPSMLEFWHVKNKPIFDNED